MNPRIQYVIDYFRKLYQIPESVHIGYGTWDGRVKVKSSKTSYFNILQNFDDSQVIWKKWKEDLLPVLFGEKDEGLLISEEKEGILVHDDLLLSAFFFLSGWQEYVFQYHKSGRSFPYEKSLQARLKITGEPIVQRYFDILRTAVEQAYQIKLDVGDWQGKSWALCLTHDVDRCRTGWLEDGFYLLKQRKFKNFADILSQRMRGRDTWFNFNEIHDLEDDFQAHSTFFFLTEKKQPDGENADYHSSQSDIQRIMDEIGRWGCGVGIHGSIGSHTNGSAFQKNLDNLGRPVLGSRFHYLSFHHPKTLAILEEAQLCYDTTLGFSDQTGFRNGTAMPFPLFDCQRNRPVPVLEIPLIVMDTTLRKDRKQQPEMIFEDVKELLNRVQQVRGCGSILWHNNYFSHYKFQGWGELYRRLLENIHEDAWLASGEEVYDHCKYLL